LNILNQNKAEDVISGTVPSARRSDTAEISRTGYILITGGAGFIGTNLAHRLLSEGENVLVYDNLSRRGSEQNLLWLREANNERLQVEIADVCDIHSLGKAVKGAKQVFHLAAQVAVTSSLLDPVNDFESNLRGTLNVLEALRAMDTPPPMVFTSTNKVYGPLIELNLKKNDTRYEAASEVNSSISEDYPIMFHSPYGCSKGAADQYVTDYVRVFGLKAVVFRMSCIYGPRQFGTEDQGWVANFLIRAIEGNPITVYGDGMQVRDLLFIEDLVDAFLLAQSHMYRISGEVFNIGGGMRNTMSLLELLTYIGERLPETQSARFDGWRSGDQKYYVTDYRKFKAATGWEPRTGARQGLDILFEWLAATGKKSQPLHARKS
jgi:CDP-paratose 2-epimerase